MNILLHICCAPCAVSCVDSLRAQGHTVEGFWYNPNIHPYDEYTSRLGALQCFSAETSLKIHYIDVYGFDEFTKAVAGRIDTRCEYCYAVRFAEAAAYAAENGFDAFTTTLLISPYQNHELITECCRRAAEKFGVEFYYADFRPLFREGQRRAKEMGLYRQKWCGCVYSINDGK